MEGLEYISFQIIAASGTARSYYIEAIQLAKKKEFIQSQKLINEADKEYIEAHRIHSKMIQKEANGEKEEMHILFIHALDQLMSAEIFGIMAKELIEIYKRIIE